MAPESVTLSGNQITADTVAPIVTITIMIYTMQNKITIENAHGTPIRTFHVIMLALMFTTSFSDIKIIT